MHFWQIKEGLYIHSRCEETSDLKILFYKLMKDYVWGYGSVICGGYFIYIVCAIGAEDFRIEFLNKYSAMYNDIKVND